MVFVIGGAQVLQGMRISIYVVAWKACHVWGAKDSGERRLKNIRGGFDQNEFWGRKCRRLALKAEQKQTDPASRGEPSGENAGEQIGMTKELSIKGEYRYSDQGS